MSQNAKNTTITKEESDILVKWIPQHFRFGSWAHCFYCGIEPIAQDHVIPWSFYNTEKRNTNAGRARGIKTPSCSECNVVLADHYFPTLSERCDAANKRLRRRYSKFMHMEAWADWEMKELKGSLRDYVVWKQAERSKAVNRVGWQYTQTFTELFDKAYASAQLEYPNNKWLHHLVKPHWVV